MPYLDFKQEKSFGDLIVKVDVTFPDTIEINMIPLLQVILEVEKDLSPQEDSEEKVYTLIPFNSDHYSPDYTYDNNSDYYNYECDSDDDSY